MRSRTTRLLLCLAAAFSLLTSAVSTTASAQSSMEQIKKSGKLRYGVVDYAPLFYRDKATGKWAGAVVDMAEDMAKILQVEAVPVETTWATLILDLQANKSDIQFAVQATPQRALVVDFAGPAYSNGWYGVTKPDSPIKTWNDINKPEVRVAVMTGSLDAQILQKMAPKATRVEVPQLADIALSVSSGRADVMLTSVTGALIAKEKNPGLGNFVRLEPYVSLPSYVAIRREPDQSLKSFVQAWAEFNVLMGYNEQRMKQHFGAAGVKELPENVKF
jgi:polar amino acid transport system substrate-binding protein